MSREIESAAVAAGFRPRFTLARLEDWFTRVAWWKLLVACVPPVALVLVVVSLPPAFFPAAAFIVYVVTFGVGYPVWMAWSMWRDRKRSKQFPYTLRVDRWAWYIVDGATTGPSWFSRPLQGAELRYLHARWLESTRYDVTLGATAIAFVFSSVTLFEGRDAVQHLTLAHQITISWPAAAMLGFVGFVVALTFRHRVVNREFLRDAIEYYVGRDP